MVAGRRRWGTAAFALVVALAGAIVGIAVILLREPGGATDATSTVSSSSDPVAAADAHGRGDPKAPRADSSKHDLDAAATPLVTAIEPRLEWPDEASLRRIERGGRALFGGIVRAPDGSPCPGATVWCGGAVVATTDDHGAWRADVANTSGDEESGLDFVPTYYFVARKEGIGVASVAVRLPSRRIDLDLVAGLSFSGTVVDFDDGTPIGGAELDLRQGGGERCATFRTRADALGRFAFPNLRDGDVNVRGRAPGYDSNGYFGYDFSKGRDVVVKYRLRIEFMLRGRFVPWPATGIAPEKATVHATTASPHDHGDTKLDFRGPISADGRFELPLPVCPSCTLALDVGEQRYWGTELDTNEERREFDVGDVVLPAAAALTGRFDVPDAELRGRIRVTASVSSTTGRVGGHSEAHLAADGSFRFDPLPAGSASVTFALGRTQLATLRDASGLEGDERSEGYAGLIAGTTRDVGVVATEETIFFGTVRDADGVPIVGASLAENVKSKSGWWNEIFSARADAEGRFIGIRNLSGLDEDEARVADHHARWEASGLGLLSRNVAFEWAGSPHWIRHDVAFEAGLRLTGKLVDADERPQPHVTILITSENEEGSRTADDVTRADGTFEFTGLDAGACHLIAVDDSGALEFDGIHPEQGPVTLRPADAKKR